MGDIIIKRNKIICRMLAIGIAFNTLLFTNYSNNAYAADLSIESSMSDTGNSTKEIDGMVIENGVETIGDSAFSSNKGLKKITIPGSVKIISKSAFDNCDLTDITIKDGVEVIGENAFEFNSNLQKIEIPDSVKLIKSEAFHHCESLKDIKYSKDAEVEINAFSSTAYHPEFDKFFIEDGVLKGIGPDVHGDVIIPDGVKEIKAEVFSNNETIKKVIIPEGVIKIDKRAFLQCPNLKEVDLPESLESIGDYTFFGCYNLTNINFKSNLKKIGKSAFHGCTNLGDISIPNSVVSIGDNAFTDCLNMANVNINTQNVSLGNDVFPLGIKINGNNNSSILSKPGQILNPGWNLIDSDWYYADNEHNMYRNQWYFDGKNWYYLGGDGKMYYGDPKEIDGQQYMFAYPNGEMITGWQYDHLMRAWYYFNPNSDGSKGAMVKSKWVYSDGKWYYLKDNGVMATDTIIDKYYVDKTGAWVESIII